MTIALKVGRRKLLQFTNLPGPLQVVNTIHVRVREVKTVSINRTCLNLFFIVYDASLLMKIISLSSVGDYMQVRPRSKTIVQESYTSLQVT